MYGRVKTISIFTLFILPVLCAYIVQYFFRLFAILKGKDLKITLPKLKKNQESLGGDTGYF